MSKIEHGLGRKERRNSLMWWNWWILLSRNKVFCFSEPARDKMINPFPGHDIPIWANVNHLTYNWPQNSPKMFSSIVARFWTFFVRLTNSFWMAHPLCNALQDKVSWLFSSIYLSVPGLSQFDFMNISRIFMVNCFWMIRSFHLIPQNQTLFVLNLINCCAFWNQNTSSTFISIILCALPVRQSKLFNQVIEAKHRKHEKLSNTMRMN